MILGRVHCNTRPGFRSRPRFRSALRRKKIGGDVLVGPAPVGQPDDPLRILKFPSIVSYTLIETSVDFGSWPLTLINSPLHGTRMELGMKAQANCDTAGCRCRVTARGSAAEPPLTAS